MKRLDKNGQLLFLQVEVGRIISVLMRVGIFVAPPPPLLQNPFTNTNPDYQMSLQVTCESRRLPCFSYW